MRIVFDLDDTIQFANYRDYQNATPNKEVIEKIKLAKKNGATIIIHTARGMLSCNGDAERADKKNRDTIEQWLEAFGVPCDELRFGKPMADAYVDDKAITVEEFAKAGANRFYGFSGGEVWQVGSRVQKYAPECDKAAFWYMQAKSISNGHYKVPGVFSYREGNIQMEYINGYTLNKKTTKESINAICGILRHFSNHRLVDNSYEDYIEYISSRIGCDICSKFRELEKKYKKHVQPLFVKGTFCHGDFSTFNIICSGSDIYLIDPCIRKWNTWLLDAAKFRACLSGLGCVLGDDEDKSNLLSFFDSHFSGEERMAIQFLELTQYLRVMPYANDGDMEKIKNLVTKIWF